jgi:hypothetical protein
MANSKEDVTFIEAFTNIDLDDLNEFEASLSSCLDDVFHVARKS